MVKINKSRVKQRRESRKLQSIKNAIEISIKIGNVDNNEEETKQSDDVDELLHEIRNIKTKRTILYWVADNKEYINNLEPQEKVMVINEIKIRFFPE